MQLDGPDFSASNSQVWSSDDVTQMLDEVYAQEPSEVDPVLLQMQSASLETETW